jgi:hypothetical protein
MENTSDIVLKVFLSIPYSLDSFKKFVTCLHTTLEIFFLKFIQIF